MGKLWLLQQVEICNANQESFIGDILIEDGVIKQVAPFISFEGETIRFAEHVRVMPGFIDIHIHGAQNADVMDATDEALHTIAQALIKEGTTSFLATTMTQSDEAISRALQAVAQFQPIAGEAQMLGIHLEGPFVNEKRAGAQPKQYMQAPTYEKFSSWQTQAGNAIRLVTLAPELDSGFLFIKQLVQDEVIVSLGHTDAKAVEMQVAVQHGARHITHLYNQMSPLHHREIGAIGYALLDEQLVVELIVDCIHSSEEAVKLAYKSKSADRIILITDAMRAKGMPYGQYDLGGQQVTVTTDARLADGTLAGSILKMNEAVCNMQAITQCSLSELVKMSSYNAAKQLTLKKGAIQEGYDADLVLLTPNFDVITTVVNGIYHKPVE